MDESQNYEPTVRDVLKDLEAHEKVCEARHKAIDERFAAAEQVNAARHAEINQRLDAMEKANAARFAALESRLATHDKLFYAVLAVQTATMVGIIGGVIALVVAFSGMSAG